MCADSLVRRASCLSVSMRCSEPARRVGDARGQARGRRVHGARRRAGDLGTCEVDKRERSRLALLGVRKLDPDAADGV